MTERPDEKVLRRIRKMLAMAEDKANIEEANVAAGMASRLMQKYNLDHADVLIQELSPQDIVAEEGGSSYKRTPPPYLQTFLVPLAKLYDCEVRYWGNQRDGFKAQFLGQRSDAIVASWVLTYLMEQIERFSRRYRRQKRKEYGGGGHGTNMDDYRVGLALSILQTIYRLEAEKAKSLNGHTTGTALVSCKQQLIREKFDVQYQKSEIRSIQDSGAFLDGRKDGSRIQINKTLEESSPNQNRLH